MNEYTFKIVCMNKRVGKGVYKTIYIKEKAPRLNEAFDKVRKNYPVGSYHIYAQGITPTSCPS